MDLTHLHLHVRDRERSVAFYQRWFGLELLRSGDEISFMKGDRDFLLALADDREPATLPPWFHFGIRQDSAERLRALLTDMQANAVPIVKALYHDEDFASFRCADPDGYAIEVYWEAADDAEPGAA